ncbi:MAG: tetratricopeptide repeat protein [Bacteroidota bacterium]
MSNTIKRLLAYSVILFFPFCSLGQGAASEGLGTSTPAMEPVISTMKVSEHLYSWGQLGGMTADRLGFVYVANFSDAVWRINPLGKATMITDGLYGASGNTIDEQGNLYQASFFGNTITRITRFGETSTFAEEGLNGPVGMVFDSDKNLYVCNCNDNSIIKIAPDKSTSVFASGALFNCPNGIAIDGEGNFMVVNFGNDHMVKISPKGAVSKFATVGQSEGNAHLVFAKNYFYVTKFKTNTLYKVDPEGNATVVAGSFSTPGHEDGLASKATFHKPNGITKSPTGQTLYLNTLVGESGSGKPTSITVRKVELVSLSRIIKNTLETNGLDAAVEAYQNYKADPGRKFEDTAAEIATMAWSFMSAGKFNEALKFFQLNAESYPDRWRSHFNLGDVYKLFQQKENALAAYRKALELSPGNETIIGKIAELDQD